MSNCKIEIALNNKLGTTYNIGDLISGTVNIEILKDIKCRKIELEILWFTNSIGAQDSSTIQKVVLKKNEELLEKGNKYTFPFEINAPLGPVTYISKDLKIQWTLEATITTNLYAKYINEKKIILESSTDKEYPLENYNFGNRKTIQQTRDFETEYVGKFIYVIGGAFFAIPGLLALISGVSEKRLFLTLFSIPFIYVGIYIIYHTYKNSIALKRLNKVSFDLEKKIVKPGDEVICKISITPKSTIELETIKIYFKGKQTISDGSVEDEKIFENTIHEEEETVLKNDFIPKYNTFTKKVMFKIPTSADPTFISNYNKINWIFTASVKANRTPKWEEDLEVVVCPL